MKLELTNCSFARGPEGVDGRENRDQISPGVYGVILCMAVSVIKSFDMLSRNEGSRDVLISVLAADGSRRQHTAAYGSIRQR